MLTVALLEQRPRHEASEQLKGVWLHGAQKSATNEQQLADSGDRNRAAGTELPKACNFAIDDAITRNALNYRRNNIVEVYRGGEIIEI